MTCVKKLQTFINGCLRKILRIPWTEIVCNETVWERTRQIPVLEEIGLRRWRLIGHTLRRDGNNIAKQALKWNPQRQRRRRRLGATWRRTTELEMMESGHSWSDLNRMTQDRDGWKSFVRGLYPDKGERY